MKYLCFIFCCLGFVELSWSQVHIQVTVYTNVNSFCCESMESSITSEAVQLKEETVINIPIASFECPNKMIEKDLNQLFESHIYPSISLRVLKLEVRDKSHKATVEIKIKDRSNTYEFNLKEVEIDNESYVNGSQTLSLVDFGIEPPTKMMGMVRVKEDIGIQCFIPIRI